MALFKNSNENSEKSSVMNVATADFRSYTPSALDSIKHLNAATVLLPKNPTAEFTESYARIKKNVATELYIDGDVQVSTVNGVSVIDETVSESNNLYFINGMAFIKKHASDKPISIITNGVAVWEKGTKINLLTTNGIVAELEFEAEHIKTFPARCEFDKEFIEMLKDNTVVLCGGRVIFEKDVTSKSLLEKNIHFAVGGRISCDKSIRSAVQMVCTAGGKIADEK